jgi:hypothetical protein
MPKEVLSVRDVDERVWRRFRAKTEEEGLKTGQALNEALDIWIRRRERRPRGPDARHFLKMNGIIRTRKPVRWSEEIDKMLYGS